MSSSTPTSLSSPRIAQPAEGYCPAAAHLLPSRAQLVRDATLGRVIRLSRLPASVRRLAGAVRVIRPLTVTHAAPTSLNQVTGPRRRFAVVDLDLAVVVRTAHAHGVTVNDVLLLTVASALHNLLATRGEDLDKVIISMPMSDRSRGCWPGWTGRRSYARVAHRPDGDRHHAAVVAQFRCVGPVPSSPARPRPG